MKIVVEEGYFTREFFQEIDGAFLTNSIMGMLPVSRIKGEQEDNNWEIDIRFSLNAVHKLLQKFSEIE